MCRGIHHREEYDRSVNLQSIIQAVASVANVLSVIVLAIGYYFIVRLYREWIHLRQETRVAGGRPQVVVTADYHHLPQVDLVVRNFTQAPAKDVSFEFSALSRDPTASYSRSCPSSGKG